MKNILLVFSITVISILPLLTLKLEAANPTFPEMKTPTEATQEIFDPVELTFENTTDKLKWIINLIYDQIILGLEWIWDTIRPIFEIVDDLIEKITGFRLAEILDALGNFVIAVFNLILEPISRLFDRLGTG